MQSRVAVTNSGAFASPQLPVRTVQSRALTCMSVPPPGARATRRAILTALTLSILPTATFGDENGQSEVMTKSIACKSSPCRPLEYQDFRLGKGPEATSTSTLYLKWTGRLTNRYGWPIQNEEADEIRVELGKDSLITGFEQGVIGMREGGKRRLFIPGELGYLDEQHGPLPRRFGDRRRLFATVLNARRVQRGGDLVIDVQLRKVR